LTSWIEISQGANNFCNYNIHINTFLSVFWFGGPYFSIQIHKSHECNYLCQIILCSTYRPGCPEKEMVKHLTVRLNIKAGEKPTSDK
jgi:hypothetical protein